MTQDKCFSFKPSVQIGLKSRFVFVVPRVRVCVCVCFSPILNRYTREPSEKMPIQFESMKRKTIVECLH